MNVPNSMWQQPSENEISKQLKEIIAKEWSEPPTALQIGFAIEFAVYFASASGFVISIWREMYNEAILHDKMTPNEIKEEINKKMKEITERKN